MILESKHIIEILKDTGWTLKGRSIYKTYAFDEFSDSIHFVNSLFDVAEELNHHPVIEIHESRVKLILTTESEGGVTDMDITLANKIDGI